MAQGEVWADDLLNRKSDADLLVAFTKRRVAERTVEGRRGSYVINLNAGWGQGKTFFLERLERQLRSDGNLVCYVNGWRDDVANEPLIAVMAAIEDALRPHFLVRPRARDLWNATVTSGGQIMAAAAKGTVKRIFTKIIGEGVQEVVEIYDTINEPALTEAAEFAGVDESSLLEAGEAAATTVSELADNMMSGRLATFKKRQKSTEVFKARMARLLKEISEQDPDALPLFVIIDELDRCRPTYAIAMLEEIKHLFDVNNIVFLIGTDTDQLCASIQAVYGSIDSQRYLHRFFHRQYSFETPTLLEFSKSLFSSHQINTDKLSSPFDHVTMFAGAMEHFQLRLREAEQCFDIMRGFVTMWEEPVKIEVVYLIPLIVLYQRGQQADFEHATLPNVNYSIARDEVWSISRSVGGKIQRMYMGDVFNHFRSRAFKPLWDTVCEERNGIDWSARWVLERFTEEFQARYQGVPNVNPKPMTLLATYPSRIRGLGRITRPTDSP